MNLLRGTFRLSIVVAGLSAAWVGYQMLEERNRAIQAAVEMELGYQCGARIEDRVLESHKNDFGNINIGKLGCSNRDFFVSMEEIRNVRANGYEAAFGKSLGAEFDWVRLAIAAVAGFAVTNLLGLAVVGARAVYRWIERGFTTP